mgnify:CR=1 FL=1
MEDKQATKRHQKLEQILEQLSRGENVQNRKLRTWLTDAEYKEFEQGWEQQKEFRKDIKEKPAEVVEYEKLLHDALFAYGRMDSLSAKGKKVGAKSLSNEADKLFEKALEYLTENVAGDYALEDWFDRALDFEAGGELGLSPQQMPRAVTSRSLVLMAI